MRQLLIATKNVGKAAEFAQIFAPLGLDVTHLAGRDDIETAPETGRTFIENASMKARFYAMRLSSWALADDSGLIVDALAGQPGVDSAHYAQLNNAGAGDDANNALLLERLKHFDVDSRQARFACVLALADPLGRTVLTTRGEMEGCIATAARGTKGFGYDPIFEVAGTNRTTAELAMEEKHRLSHRASAMRRMHELLKQYDPLRG